MCRLQDFRKDFQTVSEDKPPGSTSVRYRWETSASDRCLIKVNPKSFAIQDYKTISRGHDNFMLWTWFRRYWRFVRGMHWSPVDSPYKGPLTQGLGAFFDINPNKLWDKQSNCRWCETSWILCDVIVTYGFAIRIHSTSLYIHEGFPGPHHHSLWGTPSVLVASRAILAMALVYLHLAPNWQPSPERRSFRYHKRVLQWMRFILVHCNCLCPIWLANDVF